MEVPGTTEHLDALSRLFAAHCAYDLSSHASKQLAHRLVAQQGALPPWAARRADGASRATAHAARRVPTRGPGAFGRLDDASASAPSPPGPAFSGPPSASTSKGLYAQRAPKRDRGKRRARAPQPGRTLQSLLPRWYASHHPRCARCAIPLIAGVSCFTEAKGARCAGCGALTPRAHKDQQVADAVASPPRTRSRRGGVEAQPWTSPAPDGPGFARVEMPSFDARVPQPGKPLTVEQKLMVAKAERRARRKALAGGEPTGAWPTPPHPTDTLHTPSPLPAPASSSLPSSLPSAGQTPRPAMTLDERLKAAKAERRRTAAPSPATGTSGASTPFGTADKSALRAMLDAKDQAGAQKPPSKKSKPGLRALFK